MNAERCSATATPSALGAPQPRLLPNRPFNAVRANTAGPLGISTGRPGARTRLRDAQQRHREDGIETSDERLSCGDGRPTHPREGTPSGGTLGTRSFTTIGHDGSGPSPNDPPARCRGEDHLRFVLHRLAASSPANARSAGGFAARASIDFYRGRKMAGVLSLAMMTFMTVPVLAPSIGQSVS